MRSRSILLALFFLGASCQLFPQLAGSANPDGTTLVLRLVWPNERAVQEPVQLELLNSHGIPIQRTTTNSQGLASFGNLSPGEYRIKVSRGENNLEAISDNIVIMENEAHHDEWIHASPKDASVLASAGPPVSVADLKAPEKARKEKEKGSESLAKKDFKRALAHLQNAVEIYPQYASAWNDLGIARTRLNDLAGAREAWQKAMSADPKFVSPYLNLARILIAEKKAADAEKLLSTALAGNPSNSEGRYLLFETECMQHKFDPAMADLQKIHAAEHKRFADAHVYAAQMLLDRNQDAAAMDQFQWYLKEDPDGPRVAAVKKAMAQVQALSTQPK